MEELEGQIYFLEVKAQEQQNIYQANEQTIASALSDMYSSSIPQMTGGRPCDYSQIDYEGSYQLTPDGKSVDGSDKISSF